MAALIVFCNNCGSGIVGLDTSMDQKSSNLKEYDDADAKQHVDTLQYIIQRRSQLKSIECDEILVPGRLD